MKLTNKIIWLDRHGGRTEEDLHSDEKGDYVYMGNGEGGRRKVYLEDECTVV